ncbi:hypothetical protein TSUD_373710 [Trifolium subterraneum]|uniref:Uncharacterized protein n=1 Tax=Trifolium subterraneum TaxID=3900 RepID=A0A2Z6M723_TRISU|nr:hypothetical protein TSUD_373710 [Trifolium subterraneum]
MLNGKCPFVLVVYNSSARVRVIKRWTKNVKVGISTYSPKKNLALEPTSLQLMRSTLDLIDAQTKLLEMSAVMRHLATYTIRLFLKKQFYIHLALDQKNAVLQMCQVRKEETRSKEEEMMMQPQQTWKVETIAKLRKPQTRGVCRAERHNRASCPVLRQKIESETEGDNEYDD